MSDQVEQKPEEKAGDAPGPAPRGSGSGVSLGLGTIGSALLGLLGAAAGAGWPGVVAMALLGLGLPFAWGFLVKLMNDKMDSRDQARAGADAGKTAVDLQNQGRKVTQGLDAAESANPPTDGFKR